VVVVQALHQRDHPVALGLILYLPQLLQTAVEAAAHLI
jgi:hypothetical protein